MPIEKAIQNSGIHLDYSILFGALSLLLGVVLALVSTLFWTVIGRIKEDQIKIASDARISVEAYKNVLDETIESIEKRIDKLEINADQLYDCKNDNATRITRLEEDLKHIERDHTRNHG